MSLLLRLGIGLVLSAAIGLAALHKGSLSRSGALGAMLVGTLIFSFGGWAWGLVLVTFFVTSSRLSHYRENAKASIAADKFSKGHQRDLGQVLANGGAGTLAAVAAFFLPGPATLGAFVAAMATVNGDTWATELGVLSRPPPRLLTTGKVVEPGTSGGISLLGTLAALAGALVIGLAAAGFGALERWLGGGAVAVGDWAWVVPVAAAGGVGGALLDSLLGATVQAIHRCPRCRKETEREVHSCGERTEPLRGWKWLGNDWVNFLSALGAGLLGALLGGWLGR